MASTVAVQKSLIDEQQIVHIRKPGATHQTCCTRKNKIRWKLKIIYDILVTTNDKNWLVFVRGAM